MGSVPLASFLAVVVEYSRPAKRGCTMRILLSALSLLLLFSGCATVDGEPVASESVVAEAATWNPCTGYADKKLLNPVEQIRRGVQINDPKLIEKGQWKLVGLLSKSEMNPFEELVDAYLTLGQGARRRERAHKMATDVVMSEIMSEMRMPRVVDAVQHGFPIKWLIQGEQTRLLYAHLIPDDPMTFSAEGELVTSVRFAPTPTAPGQRPAGVALCPDARLTRFQTKAWTGEQEAQETTSNQRDEPSDFSQTQSVQQQYSVFQQPQQLIPTPGGRALLGPITPNAYGPGLNSDATGRPFMWKPDFGGPAMGPITPNAYGPGIGMDATGRPVRPACPPGMLC